jgi:hypothetical protein
VASGTWIRRKEHLVAPAESTSRVAWMSDARAVGPRGVPLKAASRERGSEDLARCSAILAGRLSRSRARVGAGDASGPDVCCNRAPRSAHCARTDRRLDVGDGPRAGQRNAATRDVGCCGTRGARTRRVGARNRDRCHPAGDAVHDGGRLRRAVRASRRRDDHLRGDAPRGAWRAAPASSMYPAAALAGSAA